MFSFIFLDCTSCKSFVSVIVEGIYNPESEVAENDLTDHQPTTSSQKLIFQQKLWNEAVLSELSLFYLLPT